MEGGRRRLFCFALQSRRRRKKAGDGCCGKTSETPLQRQRSSVRPCQSRPRMERPKQEIGWNTAMADCRAPRRNRDAAAWVAPVRRSQNRPASQIACRQRELAGVVSSDLRRCCRVWCGWKKIARETRREYLPAKRMIRASRRRSPANRSERKAQPCRGPAVAARTSPGTALLNRMGLAAKRPPPSPVGD